MVKIVHLVASQGPQVLQPITEEAVVEETERHSDDADSISIRSFVYDYVFENGRRYHSYSQGAYPLPNDEDEQERLKMCHIIWSILLNDRPWMAPLEHPQKILDIGCGTGCWAIAMGEMFPSAAVVGTDLSPIQPSWVPPNIKFYIEDAEEEWSLDKGFDMVHGRMLAGSINNWTKFFRQAFGQLRPGGWLEMNEFEAKFYYGNKDKTESVQLNMLVDVFNKASTTFGKSFADVLIIPQAMRDAGFEHVDLEVYKVPIGSWSEDPNLKKLGAVVHRAALESVESYILALGSRVLEETAESIGEIVRATKDELNNADHCLYAHAHFIWGRRPKYN